MSLVVIINTINETASRPPMHLGQPPRDVPLMLRARLHVTEAVAMSAFLILLLGIFMYLWPGILGVMLAGPAFAAALGAIAIIVFAGHGFRASRLLRNGVQTTGHIITCGFRRSEQWPIGRFRRSWMSNQAGVQWPVVFHILLYTGVAMAWVFPLVAATMRQLIGSPSIKFAKISPSDAAANPLPYVIALAITGILYVRLLPWFLREQRKKGIDTIRSLPIPERNERIAIDCEIEFRTREGHQVRTMTRPIFNDDLGRYDEEIILYDPRNPRKAVILSGLALPVSRSADGSWGRHKGAFRVFFTGICLATGLTFAAMKAVDLIVNGFERPVIRIVDVGHVIRA